ncbi:HEAT repeat domain-containing protein [Spirulina subsalsa]|uniref:HEAT repeat domain-containing protein n=1 Tax=Spirulina subsalsa TaxID=54311 RepID=UPI00036347C8|nr:HEAT repeat domain-containing protein [Spirulina subsalsa]
MTISIFTTDAHLLIRSWDATLVAMTGLKGEQVYGKPLMDLIPDLASRGLLERFQRVLREGVIETLAPALHHYLIPCPPERSSPYFDKMQQRVTIAPLRDRDEVIGTIVTLEDVTERLIEERVLAQKLAEPQKIPDSIEEALSLLDQNHPQVRSQIVNHWAKSSQPQITQELLTLLRREHRNPNVLNSVLQVLVLSHVDPIPALIDCLQDPDVDLRIYAALALGERHDGRAIPALREALKDQDTNVRYHVIEALGHLQATETIDELCEIARGGDFFLAFPALEALMRIGDSTVASRLLPLLEDELLVDQVTEVLGQLGDADVVVAMAEQLNLPNTQVLSIAGAIAKISQRYQKIYGEGDVIADLACQGIQEEGVDNILAVLPEASDEQLTALVVLLGSLEGEKIERALAGLLESSAVRELVQSAMIRYGRNTRSRARVTDLLIQQLDSPDLETRKLAADALGRIGSPRAVEALTQLLSEDPELVMVTAAALAQIGDQKAFDSLLSLMGHPESAVRLAAIAALNSLGHPAMSQRILPMLKDENPWVRESAVKIAGYFAFRECIDPLFDCLEDPEERVRRAVIEHLPYLEDDRVFGVLVRSLTQETPGVRAVAAHALGELGTLTPSALTPELFEHLRQALEDSEPWVRYQAVRSLGRWLGEMGNTPATETMIDQLLPRIKTLIEEDPANPVRAAAAKTLGQLGHEEMIPLLIQLSEDENSDPDIARAALLALGQIDHPNAVSALMTGLNSPNPERRLDAIQAFRERGDTDAGLALQWMVAADPETKVVHAAIDSLSRMATPDAIAALLELTLDPSNREACINALAQRGNHPNTAKLEYIEAIAKGLNHVHTTIRCAVVEILKRLKHPYASEFLIAALHDRESGVRLAAVSALIALGNRSCIEQLAMLTRTDPSPAVRRAAQRLLHFS